MRTFSLKNRIMFGIYLIFIVRKLNKPVLLEALAFTALFLVLASMISIRSIVANSPRDIEGFYNFIFSAFLYADLSVKAILLLMISVIGALFKETSSYVYSSTNKLWSLAKAY